MRVKPSRLLFVLLVAALALVTMIAHFRSRPVASTGGADRGGQELAPARESREFSRFGPGAGEPAAAPPAASADDPGKGDRLLESLRQRLKKSRTVPREALVSFRDKETLDRFTRLAGAFGLDNLGAIPQLHTARIRYGSLEGLRDALAGSGAEYAGVEGNPLLEIPPLPPQPDAENQGGATSFGQDTMSAINAAGDRARWGDEVTVAVLDTGVLDHPTFGKNQVTHLDLINDGATFHSHGTSVASLIGGQDPQAPGVAPAARILDVRVADTNGVSFGSVLAEGVIAAADRGAQVINISLGGYDDSALLGQAVAYAFQRGAVVVAAAGNDAYNQLAIPAAYEQVISVGSVDAQNKQAYFSNSGAGLDLTAPGVGVVTAWDTDKVALVSGTSQSSALVTAAVAAYLGWGVSANDVAARLKADARPSSASANAVGAGTLTIKPPTKR